MSPLTLKALMLLLCGLLFTACSESENRVQGTTSSANTTAEEPLAETLLLEVPPAWLEVTSQGNDTFKLAEFVPAGQDKESWSDKLFVESNALQPLPDPIVFLEAMGSELKTECEGSSDANVHSGEENGYEISVRLLICNKNLNSARGEVSLIKAIRGNDNFYVISRSRRSDPLQTDSSPLSDKEMGEWSLYMRSIKLCDARNEAHPCLASIADS